MFNQTPPHSSKTNSTEATSNNRQLMSPEERLQLEVLITIEDLPLEVILYIFSFLVPVELATLRLVSKNIGTLASDNYLWKPLTRSFFGVETVEENAKEQYLSSFYKAYSYLYNEWFKKFNIQDEQTGTLVKTLIYAVLSNDITTVTKILTEKPELLNITLKNKDKSLYGLLLRLALHNAHNDIIKPILIAKIRAYTTVEKCGGGLRDMIRSLQDKMECFLTTFDQKNDEDISKFLADILWCIKYINLPADFATLLKNVVLWLLPKTQLPLPENFPLLEFCEHRLDSKRILEYVIERNIGKELLKKAYDNGDIDTASLLIFTFNITGDSLITNFRSKMAVLNSNQIPQQLKNQETIGTMIINHDLLQTLDNSRKKLANKNSERAQEKADILAELYEAIDVKKPLHQTIQAIMATKEGLDDLIKLNEKPEHKKVRPVTFFSPMNSKIDIIVDSLKKDSSADAKTTLRELQRAMASSEACAYSPKKLTLPAI
jgi:hypothetical protein